MVTVLLYWILYSTIFYYHYIIFYFIAMPSEYFCIEFTQYKCIIIIIIIIISYRNEGTVLS